MHVVELQMILNAARLLPSRQSFVIEPNFRHKLPDPPKRGLPQQFSYFEN